MDAGPDPDDPWRLVIRLDYRVRASLSPGQLVFSVDLLPDDTDPAGGPAAAGDRAARRPASGTDRHAAEGNPS